MLQAQLQDMQQQPSPSDGSVSIFLPGSSSLSSVSAVDGRRLLAWERDIDFAEASMESRVLRAATSPPIHSRNWFEWLLSRTAAALPFDQTQRMFRLPGKDPSVALEQNISPGACFKFEGAAGSLAVSLAKPVMVRAVAISNLPESEALTAPRLVEVWGRPDRRAFLPPAVSWLRDRYERFPPSPTPLLGGGTACEISSEVDSAAVSAPSPFAASPASCYSTLLSKSASRPSCGNRKALALSPSTASGSSLSTGDQPSAGAGSSDESSWCFNEQVFSHSLFSSLYAAPPDPATWVFLGKFQNDAQAHITRLDVPPTVPMRAIQFRFLSNHGDPNTCIYRVRVHGETLVPAAAKQDTSFTAFLSEIWDTLSLKKNIEN
eukprot:GHVT01104403.1.p1 GENE.GHVT01104403.1~~GHVT01104403.1.p1  ORF type:complete len:377 (-),score=79.08 GHVT01104403.1:863-1993(-)